MHVYYIDVHRSAILRFAVLSDGVHGPWEISLGEPTAKKRLIFHLGFEFAQQLLFSLFIPNSWARTVWGTRSLGRSYQTSPGSWASLWCFWLSLGKRLRRKALLGNTDVALRAQKSIPWSKRELLGKLGCLIRRECDDGLLVARWRWGKVFARMSDTDALHHQKNPQR